MISQSLFLKTPLLVSIEYFSIDKTIPRTFSGRTKYHGLFADIKLLYFIGKQGIEWMQIWLLSDFLQKNNFNENLLVTVTNTHNSYSSTRKSANRQFTEFFRKILAIAQHAQSDTLLNTITTLLLFTIYAQAYLIIPWVFIQRYLFDLNITVSDKLLPLIHINMKVQYRKIVQNFIL